MTLFKIYSYIRQPKYPVWLCLILLLTACSKKDIVSPESRAINYTNVSYGTDSLQDMDIYLPAGRDTASTPLLVLIHGGAWVSGDKSDFAPYIDSIKKILPQYAIANINYRLATIMGNYFPVQEDDVDSAVQFLLRNITDYDISNHFVYLGVSAGGQLALLQAYKYNQPHVSAVVSFFGPSDMTDLYLHSPDTALIKYLPILMGGTPSQNPQIYFRSSPINYVSAHSCPTLLLQGGEDPLVPPAEAFHLQDTLQELGVVNQLVYYPNDGHGWTGTDLQDSFEKIQAFLDKNVE
ncbi:MAG: prolyl oligopeptidase family serine peptidase [Chitinophagaceae bacterium]